MWRQSVTIVLTQVILVLLGIVHRGETYYPDLCQQICHCQNSVVNCTERNLSLFPSNLPVWTEVLDFSRNPLETLVAEASRLIVPPNNLTAIDLSYTKLRYIKDDFLLNLFNDVTFIDRSLQLLRLDHNQLSNFPLIKSARNLRMLNLSDNSLECDSIAQIDISSVYPALEILDLSDNPIRRISSHFLSSQTHQVNHKLTTLILHNARIDFIEPNAFDQLVNLKILRLSKNSIALVSKDWLSPLSLLRELDLNNNRIAQIDTLAFNGSRSLQVLKMRRNKLSYLYDGTFWGLSKLEKLNLDHNQISDIRLSWTYGLVSLTQLTVRHNAIVSILPGSWTPTSRLTELYLSHNKLRRIEGDTMSKLSQLKVLKLNNNDISFIDEKAFQDLTLLDSLDLTNNQLSWAIESSNGVFSGLRSLKKLNLDNNEIRLILNNTFNGLTNLTQLSLSGNPISTVQSGSFLLLKNLLELDFAQTDLLCDCTMRWLNEWLQSSPIRKRFASKFQCKHPKELYKRTMNSFLDVDVNDFQCQHFLKPYMIDDFQSNDKPISAIKGKNITFYCKVATSSADVQFTWIKDNQKIEHNQQRVKEVILATAYSDNATLYTNVFTLINVQDEDQGKYQCMAANSYGTVHSHKFQINVHVMPYFIKKPQNITVKVGHTARLECAAQGQPSPHITWQKDNGNFPAAAERRMRFIPKDDVYFIVDVTKDDTGWYTCNASNDAGKDLATAYLNVIEPASFVRKMVDKDATLGSTVSLECMAAGIPMPVITWYKDGKLLEHTDRHFFTAEGQLLFIVQMKASDQGRYSCNISNMYGSMQDSLYLKVHSALHTESKVLTNPNYSNGYRKSSDEYFFSLQNFKRSTTFIILIIGLCIVVTSIVWIFVFCYIRTRGKYLAPATKTNVDPEADNCVDGPEAVEATTFNYADEQFPIEKHYYPHLVTKLDTGYDSEGSSAKDTGIEGSCQSGGESESDHFYSYTPVYYQNNHCQSLPRRQHSHNICPAAVPIGHQSLPRKSQHYHSQPVVEEEHSSNTLIYTTPQRNSYRNNIALASKKKKIFLKKIQQQQQQQLLDSNIVENYLLSVDTATTNLQTFSHFSCSVKDVAHR